MIQVVFDQEHQVLALLGLSMALDSYVCQPGLKKMGHVLRIFVDFPLTFATSSRFSILKNMNEADDDWRAYTKPK